MAAKKARILIRQSGGFVDENMVDLDMEDDDDMKDMEEDDWYFHIFVFWNLNIVFTLVATLVKFVTLVSIFDYTTSIKLQ